MFLDENAVPFMGGTYLSIKLKVANKEDLRSSEGIQLKRKNTLSKRI